MGSAWNNIFKIVVGFYFISVGTTANAFQIMQARGGAISSNSGTLYYYCSSANPTVPGVIVITGADPSCKAIRLTIDSISQGTNLNIYDGSEFNQRRTCGTSVNSSTLSYPVTSEGSMITLVLTQSASTCSTAQPTMSCSWTCLDQNQNGISIEDSGAFVNRHSGSVAYEDLNTAKRYTTAIIADGDVCLKVRTEFQEDDVAVDNCQTPSLLLHEIEDSGCLTRVYHVCGRKSSFQSENVGANLLAVGMFRPGSGSDYSNSYEIRWNEGVCMADECPTVPPAATTETVTQSSTSESTTYSTPESTASSTTASTTYSTPESTTSSTTESTTSSTTESTTSSTTESTTHSTPVSSTYSTPERTTAYIITESTTYSTPVSSTPESTSSSTTEYFTTSTSSSTASPSTSSSTASSSTSGSTTTETRTPYTQAVSTSTSSSPTTESTTSGPYGAIISRDCGGNMLIECGSFGKILYKNDSFYSNNERCAWVIHSPSGLVDITFVHQRFENYYDGCVIGEYNTSKPSFSCSKLSGNDYAQTHRARTPCVVHFTSDLSVTRPGFEIDIVPVGDACIDEHNVYTFHSSDLNGTYRFPPQGSFYDDNARPFGVIQAGQGLPMRSFYYPELDLEEYYDCWWTFELQPYNRPQSCTPWQRICGQYPAGTYSPNMTANSIATLGWTDGSIQSHGVRLNWTQVAGQYQNPMSEGKFTIQ